MLKVHLRARSFLIGQGFSSNQKYQSKKMTNQKSAGMKSLSLLHYQQHVYSVMVHDLANCSCPHLVGSAGFTNPRQQWCTRSWDSGEYLVS